MSAAGFIRLCVCLAVLPKITLSLTLVAVALGYIIASQCKGFLLVAKDTGQPCVWACIFALAGIAVAALSSYSAARQRPRYHAALPILLYLDTACVVVAFVSFCALQQPHSTVITGVSALVLLLMCASAFHSKHEGVPRRLSWASPRSRGLSNAMTLVYYYPLLLPPTFPPTTPTPQAVTRTLHHAPSAAERHVRRAACGRWRRCWWCARSRSPWGTRALPVRLSSTSHQAELRRVCSTLQVARSLEAVGLIRPIYLKKAQFEPPSKAAMYSSTYTNGHNFDSQWREYCRHQDPDNTDFLASVAGSSAGANPDHPDIRWPQVGAEVSVQVISAGTTVNSKMAGHDHNVYYTQAKAYNATLSPTHRSEWLICDGCTHGFPWMKASYLAAALTSLYQRV